jgi:hypothetical protein
MERVRLTGNVIRRPNGSEAKLCGQGPRAEVVRRGGCSEHTRRRNAICNRRDAVRYCSAEGLQPRAEAGRNSFSFKLGGSLQLLPNGSSPSTSRGSHLLQQLSLICRRS